MNLKFWKKDKREDQREEKQDIVQYRDGMYFLGTGAISAPKISNVLQAMLLSDAVYSCVTLITQAALDIPWYLYRKQGKNIVEVSDHAGLINFLENPSKKMTWPDLIEGYLNHILSAGECIIRKLIGSFGKYGEVELLRPDRVTVEKDYLGDPRYKYYTNGRLVTIDPEEIMHIKLFNPTDDLRGLSPITSIAAQIDIGSYSQAWMLALLEKGAMPAVALSTEKGLTPEQRAYLEEKIKEKFMGYQNVMNPLILEGGLKPEKMSLSPAEIDFMPLTKSILRKVCGVLNVAPELVGDSENKTYSNVKEAEKGLYEKAVSPHLKRLRDRLNKDVVPMFDLDKVGYFFDYDLSNIEALSENKEMQWKRVREAVDSGIISRNEGREEIKFGKAKDIGADKLTVDGRTLPLEAIAGGEEEELENVE